jgi:hypothetical protein
MCAISLPNRRDERHTLETTSSRNIPSVSVVSVVSIVSIVSIVIIVAIVTTVAISSSRLRSSSFVNPVVLVVEI